MIILFLLVGLFCFLYVLGLIVKAEYPARVAILGMVVTAAALFVAFVLFAGGAVLSSF